MKVFIFDTETTGLYSKKQTDIDKQPYVIQFGGILVNMKDNGEYEELERINVLIEPPIPIPYITSQIHGLYDIDVIGVGDFGTHAEVIQKYLNEADFVVGHNLKFDENCVMVEFNRLKMEGKPFDYIPKNRICTMEEGTEWCKLPKKGTRPGYKRPKLQELHNKAVGGFFGGAHDAMIDVEATLKSLSVMVKQKVVELKEIYKLTIF